MVLGGQGWLEAVWEWGHSDGQLCSNCNPEYKL